MKRNHKIVKQRLDRMVKLMKLGENIGEALYKINKLAKAYGRQGNNIKRPRNIEKQSFFYNLKDKVIKLVKGKSKGYHIDFDKDLYIKQIYKVIEIDGRLFHLPVDDARIRYKNKIYKLKYELDIIDWFDDMAIVERNYFFEYKDKDGKIKKDKELFLKRLKEKGKNYKLKTKRDSEIDISIEEEKKLFNLSRLLDKVTENKLNLNKKG